MSNENPLLNNNSVQGAASSIEGLIDPKTATIKPQEKAAPVEQKEPEEAKATEDNQEVQQQPEENLENKIQETLDEEEASEDNAERQQTTDYHQVKVNGEVIEVDLEELKAGYQKDADYRRKTEEVALEKRELLTEKEKATRVTIEPLREMRLLKLTFPITDTHQYRTKKPTAIISHLLGHEGENSLYARLNEKGLIDLKKY